MSCIAVSGKSLQKATALFIGLQSTIAFAQEASIPLVWMLVKALLAGALLLAITFVGLKAYVKWRGSDSLIGPPRDIKVCDRVRISQRLTVYSLSWGEKEYLVAEAGQGLTLLDCRDKKQEV